MSTLVIIPTPIGNMDDITARSIQALKDVDFILAEDTRHTGLLLQRLNISKSMKPYHKFNEHKTLQSLIVEIKHSAKVGLVSDAGTPGISDPGFLIVRECLNNGIELECLPGATAFLPALILSGFATDRFTFEGFLPVKKGRKTRLEELGQETRTMIFYESPHRIHRTLADLSEAFGENRRVSLSRELTKKFEETIRGNMAEVIDSIKDRSLKGEIVLVVEGFSRKKHD